MVARTQPVAIATKPEPKSDVERLRVLRASLRRHLTAMAHMQRSLNAAMLAAEELLEIEERRSREVA